MNKTELYRLIRYVVVGGTNTVIYMILYQSGLWLGLNYQVSLAAANVITFIASYFLNKYFAFRTKRYSLNEIKRFIIIGTVQYAVLSVSLTVLVKCFSFRKDSAGLILPCISMAVTYIGHRYWTFKGGE